MVASRLSPIACRSPVTASAALPEASLSSIAKLRTRSTPPRSATARRYDGTSGRQPCGSSSASCAHEPARQRSTVHGLSSSVHSDSSKLADRVTQPRLSASGSPGAHSIVAHSPDAGQFELSAWFMHEPESQKSKVQAMPSSHDSGVPAQRSFAQRSSSVHGSPSSHALPSPPSRSHRPSSLHVSIVHAEPSSQSSLLWHGRQPGSGVPATHVPL